MQTLDYATINFADAAISKVVYSEKQSKLLNYLPNQISTPNDVLKIKISSRQKIKESSKLYRMIKNDILFRLDQIMNNASLDFEKNFKKTMDALTDKNKRKFIQDTINEVRLSSEKITKFVIQYNDLSWFKDPNLISTIRFHEKLNKTFLSKAVESLDYDINSPEVTKEIKKFILNKDYVKAIIVILFQPLLSYGALYASLNHDYEYIFKYNKIVSEAAESVFYLNPSMKHIFFEQKIE